MSENNVSENNVSENNVSENNVSENNVSENNEPETDLTSKTKNFFSNFLEVLKDKLAPKIVIAPDTQKTYSKILKFRDDKNHRFHLRILNDGRGILIIDAQYVLYLDHIGMIYMQKYIEGQTEKEIQEFFVENYRTNEEEVSEHFNEILEKIQLLMTEEDANPITNIGFSPKYASEKVSEFPLRVYLALTYRTDKNGDIAYMERNKDFPELNLEELKKVIDKLWNVGVPQITLSGGEPTLRDEFMDIIEYGQNKGVIIGIMTNGKRFSDANLVKESIKKGLDYVEIMIHSHLPEVHNKIVGSDSFNETVQAIKNFEAEDIYFMTKTILCKENIDTIEDTVRFLREKLNVRVFELTALINSHKHKHPHFTNGIDDVKLNEVVKKVKDLAEELDMDFHFGSPIVDHSFNPHDYNLGLTTMSPANSSITIEPNGDVLPVQHYFEPAGNILMNDWESIWDSDLFKKIRKRGLKPKASEHDLLTFCGGGSPLHLDE